MNITVGRIVHYVLTANDVERINRRHTNGRDIVHRENPWPHGTQAHVGDWAVAGDVLPMLVVRVWSDKSAPGGPGVNGQVFLDGNDVLWVTSVREDALAPGNMANTPGTWHWPPRE